MNEYFKDVHPIKYEGSGSKNPLSFKYYNADEKIGGKTMKDHLRFSVAYWHTMTGTGTDPFGAGTMIRPWDNVNEPMEKAKVRMHVVFEFIEKLGIPFYCFHDRDIAPEADTLERTNRQLDEIVKVAKELQKATGIKLLWGTANLFNNPRYVHGASTSCNADVFAYAAAQVKKALEVTLELGGENYVFWGGREGYETLLNTDLKLELDNYARFLGMAVDYAKKIGFRGQFLVEPKPKEPTKHQYDFDCATIIGFLNKYGLDKNFKLNIEVNHATLAGHTFQHELYLARINGMLGSIDANQGDLLLGWDTDQFPTDLNTTTLAMFQILKNGGLHSGGTNFDAKVRRASFEPVDLFYSHIAGMDAFARGLKVAQRLIEDKVLDSFVEERYASYGSGIGKEIVNGSADFNSLEKYALSNGRIANSSGRQEMLEALINQYIIETK